MKYSSRACLLLSTALSSGLTNAFRIKVAGRLNSDNDRLTRRGSVQGSSPLTNSADITYYTNLTLGGTDFSVLIDTGSADLWVASAGTIPNAKSSGKSAEVNYAIGKVKGPIKFADLEFSGFKVPDAAYMEVSPDKTNKEGKGLIGLGPAAGSNIFAELNGQTSGAPVLDRIFLQNLTTPNYLTVNLGRFEDPTDIFGGDMSIGEVLPGLDAILQQPKLAVAIVPVRQAGDQHFQILIDENGVIGPDGKPLDLVTEVQGVKNPKQLTAVVDTGFSLTQVPRAFADNIYSRFQGAEFVNVTGVGDAWIVPCDQEVNVTMKFGGVSIPIHPLDSALNPSIINLEGVVNSEGKKACIGTFQPMVFNRGSTVNYDIILGMSFIRNVYALFDFGDFIGGHSDREDPYLQFLSTTDPAEAHTDFVTVRLDGNDSTGDQKLGAAKSSGNSTPAKKGSGSGKTFGVKTIYLILGAAALGLAFLLAIGSFCLFRRRRNSASAYKPLHDPAPMKLDMMPTHSQQAPYVNNASYAQPYNAAFPTQPLYDPPTQPPPMPSYPTPWDQQRPH